MCKVLTTHTLFYCRYSWFLLLFILILHKHDTGLEADLRAVDRSVTPWIVVSGHRPLYSSEDSYTSVDTGVTMKTSFGGWGNSYGKNLRAAFEGLFLKYGVDLYINGHVHWVCSTIREDGKSIRRYYIHRCSHNRCCTSFNITGHQ